MTYIEQFEAELVQKLQSSENPAAIVRWAGEQVLMSYKKRHHRRPQGRDGDSKG